jgi:cytochrome oxidase Cu insertion factor (SCO1/SenC/PrrC family)
MRLAPLLLAAAAGCALAAEHQHPPRLQPAPGYAPLSFALPAVGSYELPPLGGAADAPVLGVEGGKHRLHDFYGDKIAVLSFIYTSCSDVNGCPLATFVLKSVQDRVLASSELRDKVRLISISFDPDHDTPAVLAEYSRNFRQPNFDWLFLTTESERALAPLLDAYDQWVVRDYDENGNYLGTISHLLRVYLIDRHQRIRNIYSMSFLHADTVASDIRTLLAEED